MESKTKTTEYKPVNKKREVNVSEGEVLIHLCKNKFVSVRKFNGKHLVDIREYYEKDGENLPGKKGVALTLDAWESLKEKIEMIDEAIASNK